MKVWEGWIRGLDTDGLWKLGENLWSKFFQMAQVIYEPLCDIARGGAPMTLGGKRIILPDFNIHDPQFSVYLDSKAKKSAVKFRIANNELRHGIDKKSYLAYVDISETTRKHCWLGIFEAFTDVDHQDWSGSVLLQSMSALGEPFDGVGTLKGKMVYWPRQRFVNVGSVTPAQVVVLAMPDQLRDSRNARRKVISNKLNVREEVGSWQVFVGPSPKIQHDNDSKLLVQRYKDIWLTECLMKEKQIFDPLVANIQQTLRDGESSQIQPRIC